MLFQGEIFKPFLVVFLEDDRVNVWHMALIFAICQLARSSDWRDPIIISRRKVMRISHINNYMTYHKYIRELQELGYIQYIPSYHPAIGSTVKLIAQ